MNLRKIEADSYREALAKVRSAYGEDALIVGTRTLQRGGVLGLGGKQVVEVYVTETKSRAEKLNELRARSQQAPASLPAPPADAFRPGAAAYGAAPGGFSAQATAVFEQRAPGVVDRPPPGGVYEPSAPGPQHVSVFPRTGTYEPTPGRVIQPVQMALPQFAGGAAAPAARGPASPERPEVDARLAEIGAALEQLRGEVQSLLRRSEGPPWGHPMLDEAYALLRGQDVEEELARIIVARFDRQVLPERDVGNGALRGIVAAHTARFIKERGGELPADSPRVSMFIGPTGVGKTTTIAKLAARERYTYGRRVGLVTLDTFRIAAVDQLRKYADIIGLELKVVSDASGFAEAVAALDGCARIFVDSAGRSPSDELRLGELESFVRAAPDARVSLVLSVTGGARTLVRSIERFARVGFSDLVLTKLDETQSPGVVLTAIHAAGRPVSFLTNGQNVPDDIEAADPQRIADLIVQGG